MPELHIHTNVQNTHLQNGLLATIFLSTKTKTEKAMTKPQPITLDSLKKNPKLPPRICIYGPPGVGKTSFCAAAPNPVFILTEDGLGDLDVTTFPLAKAYSEVTEALNVILKSDHDYKTLVIDSMDWLEPLIWDQVCLDKKVESIEDLKYGVGYVEACAMLRRLMMLIDRIRVERGMIIITTAHSQIKKIDDPMQPSFDAYGLKLNKRCSAILEEFSDVILFVNYQTTVMKEDAGFGSKRSRAVGNGERIMYAQGTPAFTAKNRYNLPATLPLSWDVFFKAMTTKGTK